MLHKILKLCVFSILSCVAVAASAEKLVVRYAAANFEGAPQFRVSAHRNGSSKAVWNSNVITAVGGYDTAKKGEDLKYLQWQNVSIQIPDTLAFDYLIVRYLNDHCCGKRLFGERFGDRDLFIKSLKFQGKTYMASSGTQNTCAKGKPGEMYCNGTLKLKISNANARSSKKTNSTAQANKSNVASKPAACKQDKSTITANQSVLKDLGFYTSVVDGISGPNYRRAVSEGEKLLGPRADEKAGCLSASESAILSSIHDASRKGSQCKSLLSVDEVKTTFELLKELKQTNKSSLGYDTPGGLMWMIDKISDLEAELATSEFYKINNTSRRDCRLDRDELNVLEPIQPKLFTLVATSSSLVTVKVDSGTGLRLTAEDPKLETSKMSKNVFGKTNKVAMDIKFSIFEGNPVLDFVISEKETKINLHVFGNDVENRNQDVQMPELALDNQPGGASAFHLRMFSDGSTNIKNGEFAKIMTKMDTKDKAVVSALCDRFEKLSSTKEGFAASFSSIPDRDVYQSSNFSSEPVRQAIGLLSKQCVDAIREKGKVIATFDVKEPTCTPEQKIKLEDLDAKIGVIEGANNKLRNDIDLITGKKGFYEDSCGTYQAEFESKQTKITELNRSLTLASSELDDLNANIATGTDLMGRLSEISQLSELCSAENKSLRQQVNDLVESIDATGIIVCTESSNPMIVLLNELKEEIEQLRKLHISPAEIAEIENMIVRLESKRIELATQLAAVNQTKASPVEINQQQQKNAGLRDTAGEIEGQIDALEHEISSLRGIMNDNASLISQIDRLNAELVNLNNQKIGAQAALEQVKSVVLQAYAKKTQLELQIKQLESQISDLKTQLGASSSTVDALLQEVEILNRAVAEKQKRIESLNVEVTAAQTSIDGANSAIASNSQEIAKLEMELNAKNAEATTLKMSIDTLGPQADAAEKTLQDLETSLGADFVPLQQYNEQKAKLSELTEIVTQRTKFRGQLVSDLVQIERDEELLVNMCLEDVQCKAAMADRLGVE